MNGSVEASFKPLRPWIRMCEVGSGAAEPEQYLRAYRARWLELTGAKS